MKTLSKLKFSAAVLTSVLALSAGSTAFAASTSAGGVTLGTPFDAANSICSSGDINAAFTTFPLIDADKAIALGEVMRRLNANAKTPGSYNCSATTGAVQTAFTNLGTGKTDSEKAALLKAFNDQVAFVNNGTGNGVKGLETPEGTEIADTLVRAAASEAVSGK